MIIYLADLVHNYYPGLNTVPLNIAYVAAHAKKYVSSDIDFGLYKYCDDLLDAIDKKQPALIGLSNYTWNEHLNDFVGRHIRKNYPNIPIIMGGPNIRYQLDGIQSFLETNDFIDVYITFEGEVPFSALMREIRAKYPDGGFTGENIRGYDIKSCFSLIDGRLIGQHDVENKKELDYIPSPYQMGLLDKFLEPEFIPLFESNRGCPYTCSYCTWGSSARRKVKLFCLERVVADMEYVAKKGKVFHNWTFADANFGMFARDVEIANEIRSIYEKYHPFHSVSLWWDKNARDHIVDIAKILKGLSKAYIAFQTFDPEVEKQINRKNISITKLHELSKSLASISDRFHTDILLGLTGETMDSHLLSLQRAYESGFDSIGGGEIRLLKGSDLETPEYRKNDETRTKYRLIQEGFGIYRGTFVAEFEESVRSTKWITEEEMLELRVLRAIFYGAITIGEFGPLMNYLKKIGINVINVIKKVIEMRNSHPVACESIDWLFDKARNEWFESPQDAYDFFSDAKNRQLLLENPTIKLNYDFLSYLMLSKQRYDAFYDLVQNVIVSHYDFVDSLIVSELLKVCKARNYVMNCMNGLPDSRVSIPLADNVIDQLIDGPRTSRSISFEIDDELAKSIFDSVNVPNLQIQAISLILQKYPIYLRPNLG